MKRICISRQTTLKSGDLVADVKSTTWLKNGGIPKRRMCSEPVTDLVYVKTHKTASTTTRNVLNRYLRRLNVKVSWKQFKIVATYTLKKLNNYTNVL